MTRLRLSADDEAAMNMIREAGLQPTVESIAALGTDLYNLACEIAGDDYEDPLSVIDLAVRELQTRIGGLQNLQSYLACIVVK